MKVTRNVLLLLVLVSGSSIALWQPAAPEAAADGCASASTPRDAACVPPGLVAFTLPSGRRALTHGPDGPAPHDHPDTLYARLTEQLPEPRLRSYPYVCATDAEPHNRVLYARAPDVADRFPEIEATLREWVLAANTMLHAESLEFDVATDYRMLCDEDGQLRIDAVVLPTPVGESSYYTISADAETAGFASPRAKYWIFYDHPGGVACGQAEFAIDPQAGPDNPNNAGPSYAVTWPHPRCPAPWMTMMHENAHNLGAVQPVTPNSDRYAHCLDGADIMCYVGIPPIFSFSATKHALVCHHVRFDCGHDDYFNPKPDETSYLAHFWNLGARYNRFFAFADVPSPPESVGAARVGAGDVRVSWTPVLSTPAPTFYRVYHGDGNVSTMAPAVEVPATGTSATFPSSATYFLVTAVAPEGESRPSARATVAP